MPPKPDLNTMRRVENLLREQLIELGEDPALLPPHEISAHMFCAVRSDGGLSYSWRGRPLLDVQPQPGEDGQILWRFFTRDTPVQ